MNIQKCTGARDMLPKDTIGFRFLEDIFRRCCERWGYQEVRTPTLEYLHLFTASGTLTPGMLRNVYSFLDWDGWSGERVVLRPDGTIPVVRLYVENLLSNKVARLFYITNVFSFEGSNKENRERWQCGVEFIGDKEPTADVETILLALEMFKDIGLNYIQLDLSHTGLIKALLDELNLSPEKEAGLLTELREGNWKVLTKMKDDNPDFKVISSLFLEMKGKYSSLLDNLKSLPRISAKIRREIEKLQAVTTILDALNVEYQIDLTSASGYEYYTGLCYQFIFEGIKIGGGGRYDDLVPLIGNTVTPACGFAVYIDPLMKLVIHKDRFSKNKKVVIFSDINKPSMIAACHDLAKLIRSKGFLVEMGYSCNTGNIRWIIEVKNATTFNITDNNRKIVTKISSSSDVIDFIWSQK